MRTISFCLAREIGKRKETVFALRKILIDSASFLFYRNVPSLTFYETGMTRMMKTCKTTRV